MWVLCRAVLFLVGRLLSFVVIVCVGMYVCLMLKNSSRPRYPAEPRKYTSLRGSEAYTLLLPKAVRYGVHEFSCLPYLPYEISGGSSTT